MRAQRHTGLIVRSLAPRPHYPYNCMSGTFSSAVQPRLRNSDKHSSHVNSPSGPLFGQDGDVITRIPIGNKNPVCCAELVLIDQFQQNILRSRMKHKGNFNTNTNTLDCLWLLISRFSNADIHDIRYCYARSCQCIKLSCPSSFYCEYTHNTILNWVLI